MILSPHAKIVSGFKPIMPVFQGLVSEEQLTALVAYIKSLSPAPSGAAGGASLAPAGRDRKTLRNRNGYRSSYCRTRKLSESGIRHPLVAVDHGP